jgi:hypothetical protein
MFKFICTPLYSFFFNLYSVSALLLIVTNLIN